MSAAGSASFEIGPRTEEDVRQLFGLAQSVFGSEPGWDDREVLDSLTEDVVFVAKEHGRPAGYVALRPTEQATIVEQRQGVGRRLLAFAEGYAIAEHMRALRVVVEQGNDPARSFYRRSGFVPVEAEVFELILPQQ